MSLEVNVVSAPHQGGKLSLVVQQLPEDDVQEGRTESHVVVEAMVPQRAYLVSEARVQRSVIK